MSKKNLVLSIIIIFLLVIIGVYICQQKDRSSEAGEAEEGGELIGGQKDDHGCLIAAGYSWCETKQKCLRPWEEVCGIEPDESDIASIKQAFINKYGKDSGEIQIYISQFDGRFARGGVKFTMNGEFGEGGIFLAYKKEDIWKLAFDGNGMYSCAEMKGHGFGDEMIPDCYENKSIDL